MYFRIVKKEDPSEVKFSPAFARSSSVKVPRGDFLRAGNPFPPDPRTMAANVLVNVIRTVATEERVLFSRGRDGKLARTQSRFRLRYLTVN